MNAIELLTAEHDKVGELFDEFKANEDGDNKALFAQIKVDLDAHTHIEETIFYPKMLAEGDEELKQMVLEGIEEHRQVKMFIKELASLSEDSDKFNPKLKVLVEDTEHHVEEEENEMFPLVEDQFDESVLEQLGAELKAERSKFMKSASASA